MYHFSREKDENNTYNVRPPFAYKFHSGHVQAVLKAILREELEGKTYDSIDPSATSFHLMKLILKKLDELPYKAYKYVVNVVITEQRGQGLRYSSYALWDPDTDNIATHYECFDDICCIVSVFGIYHP